MANLRAIEAIIDAYTAQPEGSKSLADATETVIATEIVTKEIAWWSATSALESSSTKTLRPHQIIRMREQTDPYDLIRGALVHRRDQLRNRANPNTYWSYARWEREWRRNNPNA